MHELQKLSTIIRIRLVQCLNVTDQWLDCSARHTNITEHNIYDHKTVTLCTLIHLSFRGRSTILPGVFTLLVHFLPSPSCRVAFPPLTTNWVFLGKCFATVGVTATRLSSFSQRQITRRMSVFSYTHMTLTLTPWPWNTTFCRCISTPKMKFPCQDIQKLEPVNERHTHRQTDVTEHNTMPHSQVLTTDISTEFHTARLIRRQIKQHTLSCITVMVIKYHTGAAPRFWKWGDKFCEWKFFDPHFLASGGQNIS